VGEIPGQDNPKTNILQLVYQWLYEERNGRWLMILDNADDGHIFFSGDELNGKAPLPGPSGPPTFGCWAARDELNPGMN
jgi:hypothetical protein